MTTTGVFGRDDFFLFCFLLSGDFFSLSLTNKYPSPFSSGTLFVLWCALVFDSKVANRDFPGSLVHLNVTSFFGRVLGEERCELWYTKKYSLSVDIFVSFFFPTFLFNVEKVDTKKSTTTTEEEQQQRRDEKNARARPTRRRAPETLFY